MKQNSEKKIVISYLLIGFIWIVFSDKILYSLIRNSELYHLIQTYKGWLYVFLTGIIFYFILHKTMDKLRHQSKELEESYQQLEADNEEFIALN